eukprot:13960996-Alexandrium_andersonii.AAC.1
MLLCLPARDDRLDWHPTKTDKHVAQLVRSRRPPQTLPQLTERLPLRTQGGPKRIPRGTQGEHRGGPGGTQGEPRGNTCLLYTSPSPRD